MKSDATLEPNKAYEGKVATIIIPKDTPKQQLYRLSPISVLFKLVIGFVLPYGFLFSNLIWLEISALARALLWACIVAYTVGFVIYIIFCILHYNRKTKRLLNFACCSLWTSHLAMVLVLIIGFVAAHNISLHRRRVGIIYIIISGGIVYSIGNAGLRYRRKYDVNVFLSLCCALPFMAGVTCISVFLGGAVSDENYISSGFAMSLVIPGFSAYFVFLWFLKNKLRIGTMHQL